MKQLMRLFTILRVSMKYRLDTFIPQSRQQLLTKLLIKVITPFYSTDDDRGVRLRTALQELGPVFVKFGQLLSTRRDLLPPDIADELALLQDQVPPFDSSKSVAIIEAALGQPVTQAFAEFSEAPLASASVAQVHAAKMHDGLDVVVKVIRPGIEKVIHKDIQLLFLIARMVERFSLDGRRMRLTEVVSDYEHTIFDELDLKREAANCSQLKRNFEETEKLRSLLFIPAVIWKLSGPNIMVMERIYGVPVSDIETLNKKNTNLKALAESGVEIFFTQVFEHNFFHADMHPGNIFVDDTTPATPRYIGIDCAIMGSLSDFDRYYLARNLLAVFNRDYSQVARLHIESGWVPPGTNVQSFEGMIRSACEPIFEKPLSEISFGTLLIYLFQVARRFGMEVQPSLVLLQKTLLNIEGLGRQLYPDLDLWQTAHPFLENWMAERYSPKRLLSELKNQSPALLEALPALPDLLLRQLHQFNGTATSGSAASNGTSSQLQGRIDGLERALDRQQNLLTAVTVIALLSLLSAIAYLALN
ncbi:MAG TPA: ubiquinone biosynthesis regulatory protein kinase UbiB [Cellvibrionales bacterium]|jgi:ubiquinone biosynthesis protein|nr:ubiquinone biosynthesis regulatory protein kinase UbiB [Cellvibrionales bacterium]